MKKNIVTMTILIVVFAIMPLFAEESKSYYEKGSSMFTVKAGIGIPAFYVFPNATSRNASFSDDMNTKLGGYGALSYQVFISQKAALGGELGYSFNYSEANKILTTVPITFKATWVPVQTGKFDIMLGANIGIAYNKYYNTKRWAPYINITLNPTFYIGRNWGIGVNAGLWLNYDLYTKEKTKNSNCLMGMIPVTLSVTYRK